MVNDQLYFTLGNLVVELILSGTTRIVILTKHHAVKIPNIKYFKLFLCGWLANIQEYELSQGNFTCLAKVKQSYFNSFIIIQKRLDNVNHRGLFWVEYKKILLESVIPDIHLSDVKPENYGYDKGILKRIDYGS